MASLSNPPQPSGRKGDKGRQVSPMHGIAWLSKAEGGRRTELVISSGHVVESISRSREG